VDFRNNRNLFSSKTGLSNWTISSKAFTACKAELVRLRECAGKALACQASMHISTLGTSGEIIDKYGHEKYNKNFIILFCLK
jgi:hypothetical protein